MQPEAEILRVSNEGFVCQSGSPTPKDTEVPGPITGGGDL